MGVALVMWSAVQNCSAATLVQVLSLSAWAGAGAAATMATDLKATPKAAPKARPASR
ncbi:hypothetical protein [Streptomyces sp. NPDC059918]|uniref:hypothetical protein n=1 Tax=unclassified Streptomyces TaxID=2593676 RepID=UPI003648E48C